MRRDLPKFVIRTVQEEGWAGLENGNLLRRASGHFDVLLTVDQRLRYQQNVSQHDIGIVVVETIDTTVDTFATFCPTSRTPSTKSGPAR
ncbi:MAG: hypothetical protein JOZ54_25930 [Acidobacteria bacterium]|nr:hypothetical protein [Acidobacteriota bacterium]